MALRGGLPLDEEWSFDCLLALYDTNTPNSGRGEAGSTKAMCHLGLLECIYNVVPSKVGTTSIEMTADWRLRDYSVVPLSTTTFCPVMDFDRARSRT